MRARLLTPLLLLVAVTAVSQTPPTSAVITAAGIQDISNTPLGTGQLCLTPVAQTTGQAANYAVIGNGQRSNRQICTPVTNGAISPWTVTNTAATWPGPACYRAEVDDSSGNPIIGSHSPSAVTGYQCVQMSSTWCSTISDVYTCNWDSYVPDLSAQVPVEAPALSIGTVTALSPGSTPTATLSGVAPAYLLNFGLVTGSAGTTGAPGLPCAWEGNWTASTAYTAGQCYASAGYNYLVRTTYTSGATFGSTDTTNASVYGAAVGGAVSGTTGYLALFTGSTAAGNSLIQQLTSAFISPLPFNSPNTPNTWIGAQSAEHAQGTAGEALDCSWTASNTDVHCSTAHFPATTATDGSIIASLVHGGVNPGAPWNVAPTLLTTITGVSGCSGSPSMCTDVTVAIAPSTSVQGPATATCNMDQYTYILYGCTGVTFNYGDIDKSEFVVAGAGNPQLNDSNLTVQTDGFISTTSMYVTSPAAYSVSSVAISMPGATFQWGPDDTSALQAGTTAGCNTGAGFTMEPGRYLITADVVPCSNLYMVGTGTGDTIIMPVGPGISGIFYGSKTVQLQNVYMAHFQIDGRGMRNSTYVSDISKGLTIDNGKNIWIEDVYCHHTGATCFALDQTQMLTIRNNTAEWFGLENVFLSSSQIGASGIGDGLGTYDKMPHLIEGNTARHCGGRCFFVEALGQLSVGGFYNLSGRGVRMVNNYASDPIMGPGNVNTNMGYCFGDQGAVGAIIGFNTAEDCPVGIKISGHDFHGAAYANGTLVIGNTINNSHWGISTAWATGSLSFLDNLIDGTLFGATNPGPGLATGYNIAFAQTQFPITTAVRVSGVTTLTVPTISGFFATSLANVYGVADTSFNCSSATALCFTFATVTGSGPYTITYPQPSLPDASSTGGYLTDLPGYSVDSLQIAGGRVKGFPNYAVTIATAHAAYGDLAINGVDFVDNGGTATNAMAAIGSTGTGASITRLNICNNTYTDDRATKLQKYAFFQTNGQVGKLEFCSNEASEPPNGPIFISAGSNPSSLLLNGKPYYTSNMVPDSPGDLWTVSSPLSYVPGAGADGLGGFLYTGTGTGSSPSHVRATGPAIPVIPGNVYSLGCDIDASNSIGTSGQALCEISTPDFSTYLCSVTSAEGFHALMGLSAQCTIPAGVTSVVPSFDLNGVGVSSGQPMTLSAVMVNPGSFSAPYRPNFSTGGVASSVPPYLQYLGTGADGANTNASGGLSGVKYYTNFTVPFGNTVTVNSSLGLAIFATGTCTIAGTINARGVDQSSGTGNRALGAGGGGGGGGASVGTLGQATYFNTAFTGASVSVAGTAGSIGSAGGTATTPSASTQRAAALGGGGVGGYGLTGGSGGAGGSSGGAGGFSGSGVLLSCASITGTDGTHVGTIDTSGGYGTPSAANSTGSGGGGGAGPVILSSRNPVTTWPTIYTAPGSGAGAGTTTTAVPEAIGYGGSCTTEPVYTLAVSAGALSTCTVAVAGAGCGTGTNWNYAVVGGGGTLGTGSIATTWSGGAAASCTTTAGTSSGYTSATYTTSGTGGNGGAGWFAEFAGW